MKNQARSEADRWFQEAQYDLETARYLAEGRRFNTACFVAQQAAEKAVKAFLYAQGVEEPWGHSVATLLGEAATFDQSLGSIAELGAVLDKFYIPTRYPNSLPGSIPSRAYVAADADQAIGAAEQVLAAVRQRIG